MYCVYISLIISLLKHKFVNTNIIPSLAELLDEVTLLTLGLFTGVPYFEVCEVLLPLMVSLLYVPEDEV